MAAVPPAAAAPASVPDVPMQQSPAETPSSVHFAPQAGPNGAELLCASSWDGSISIWEVNPQNGENVPRAIQRGNVPVLTTAWGGAGADTRIASGNCDGQVQIWNVQANQTILIGTHEKPVQHVRRR
jgi:WD40 repeat protein